MDRINLADQLAAIVRAQLVSLRPGHVGSLRAKDRTTARAKSVKATPQDPAALAATRIRAIAPDEPNRPEKALRVFLECVLVSELGDALVSDPAFYRMLDHVQQQLLADVDLRVASMQAAKVLLDSADG